MNPRRLLRTSYWIGAIADFAFGVAMLCPPIMARMLGVERVPDSLDTRIALMMGAALMFGWTVLLIWADRKPFERKGILLITIFPAIIGLASATLYGYQKDYIPLNGALPIWILQIILSVLFLWAYLSARKLAGQS